MLDETKTAYLVRRRGEGAAYSEIAAELSAAGRPTTVNSLQVLMWKHRHPDGRNVAARDYYARNCVRLRAYGKEYRDRKKAADPSTFKRQEGERYTKRLIREATTK